MDAIRERASEVLRAAGGWLGDEPLMRRLFGGSGPAWLGLLERVLADPRFERTLLPENGWRLVAGDADDGLVALAIETTGQDPARAALVQLAACRIVDGRPGPVFSTFVEPSRPLPRWLADRLAVDLNGADEVCSLADALDRLAAFIGGATIVAFDARWVLQFVNAQCRKVGRPLFANRARDLLPAISTRSGDTKPAIAVVASQLGLPLGRQRRGVAEAKLVAALAVRLAAVDTLPTTDRLVEIARTLPDSPGVYVFRSAAGEALYVGKAKRLRRRVLSYLTRPPDHERDLRGLRTLTAAIDWRPAPDDLAAALLEMELISTLRPRFNTQRRAAPAPVWIELSPTEPFPRLRRVVEPGPGRVGPYPSGAQAARDVRLLTSVFPLRTCARKVGVPRKTAQRPPCRLLAQGRCLGPCTGKVSVTDYASLVGATSAALAGDWDVAIREAQCRAQAAAARGDRAESERLRGVLRTLVARSSTAARALSPDPANLVLLLPPEAPERAYVVVGGLLRWHGPLNDLSVAQLAASTPHDVAARGGIIARRWLSANPLGAMTVPLSPMAEPAEIVARVQRAVTERGYLSEEAIRRATSTDEADEDFG